MKCCSFCVHVESRLLIIQPPAPKTSCLGLSVYRICFSDQPVSQSVEIIQSEQLSDLF